MDTRNKIFEFLTGMLLLIAGGLLLGFLIGRGTAPVSSLDGNVIVTKSASPEDAARDGCSYFYRVFLTAPSRLLFRIDTA